MSTYTYKIQPLAGSSTGDVDATNSYLVIGNQQNNVINIYDMPSGTLNGQYSASNTSSGDNFGKSVSINDTNTFIGAPNNSTSGSVYKFNTSNGSELDSQGAIIPKYLQAPSEVFTGGNIDLTNKQLNFIVPNYFKDKYSQSYGDNNTFPAYSISGHTSYNFDSGSITINLANNFTFYNTSYSTLYINEHGNITFDSDESSPSSYDWDTFHSKKRISPFFTEMDITSSSSSGLVYVGYRTTFNSNDTIVITYNGVYPQGSTTGQESQIVLFLDNTFSSLKGNISFFYGSVSMNSAITGISNGNIPNDIDDTNITLDLLTTEQSISTSSISFGSSLSYDGSTLLIGSDNYLDNGIVYVFSDGFIEFNTLIPSDSSPSDFSIFGNSIAQNTNHIVIGSYGADTYSGAVYIYTKSGYTETKKTISDSSNFGYAVDANDTYIVATATAYGTPQISSPGAVVVYNSGTLTQDAIISGSDFGNNVTFGSDVKITSESRIIVGVSGYDFSNGAVGIYTKNGSWQLSSTLTPDVSGSLSFGYRLSYNDNYDFVYFNGGGGEDAGIYGYSSSSICFIKDTMVMTNNGSIAVQDLERGMRIKTLNGYKMLARLIVTTNKDNTDFVTFKKNSISKNVPNKDLTITCGHPVYYNGDYYNPEDFANNSNFPNVKYLKANKCKLYQLQFETHEVVYVNNFTATSLPPYTEYLDQHLPKEFYFNKKLFNENNIGKNYPPYTLHDIPLVNGKLKEY